MKLFYLFVLVALLPAVQCAQDAAVTVSQPYIYESNINTGTLLMRWDVLVMNGGIDQISEYPVFIPAIDNYLSYEVYSSTVHDCVSGPAKVSSSIQGKFLAFLAKDIPPYGMKTYLVQAGIKGVTVQGWLNRLEGDYYDSANRVCVVYEMKLKNNTDYEVKDSMYTWNEGEISEVRRGSLRGEELSTWQINGVNYFKITMGSLQESNVYVHVIKKSAVESTLEKAFSGNIVAVYGLISILAVGSIASIVMYRNRDKPKKVIMKLREKL